MYLVGLFIPELSLLGITYYIKPMLQIFAFWLIFFA